MSFYYVTTLNTNTLDMSYTVFIMLIWTCQYLWSFWLCFSFFTRLYQYTIKYHLSSVDCFALFQRPCRYSEKTATLAMSSAAYGCPTQPHSGFITHDDAVFSCIILTVSPMQFFHCCRYNHPHRCDLIDQFDIQPERNNRGFDWWLYQALLRHTNNIITKSGCIGIRQCMETVTPSMFRVMTLSAAFVLFDIR